MNVLYHLAKGLGTLRPNSNESRFPVSRMPFGLLQYMTTFFTSTNTTHVSGVRIDLLLFNLNLYTCRLCVKKVTRSGLLACTLYWD